MLDIFKDCWVLLGASAKQFFENPPSEIVEVIAYNPRLPFLVYVGERLADAQQAVGLKKKNTGKVLYVDDTDPGGPLEVICDC